MSLVATSALGRDLRVAAQRRVSAFGRQTTTRVFARMAAIGFLSISACAAPELTRESFEMDGVKATIRSASFAVGEDGFLTIATSITNASARTIYVSPSGGSAIGLLERRNGLSWDSIHVIKPAALGELVAIPTGGVYEDVARINLLRGVMPALLADEIVGEYRAVYGIFGSRGDGRQPHTRLQPAARTTDTFQIQATVEAR